MSDFYITPEGVFKLLKNLNPHKACGPDNIKPIVLKELADVLTPIVTLIFQDSLKQGVVPTDWQKANVTPIYKKGEKYKAINYRPVSLTCVLCKTMEHVIASQIMKFLSENKIWYNFQHGFRSGLSTETQLVEFSQDILSSMNDGLQTDVIVMDFSKAFDKVSHSGLLKKMKNYA